MSKKKWLKPELVILFRGKPEESVLTVCRYNAAPLGTGGEQSEMLGHGCQATRLNSCQACQSLGGGNS